VSCACGGGCSGCSSSWPSSPPFSGTPQWRHVELLPPGGVPPLGAPGSGQPDRAPAALVAADDGWPWWVWLLVALVGYQLLKGGS
jgi:hypothetical protein